MSEITVETAGKWRYAKFWLDAIEEPLAQGEGETFEEALRELGSELDCMFDRLPD